MRKILCLSILACGGLWAQAPADPMSATPETVVGIVDGVKVTAAELQFVVANAVPQLKEVLQKNPMELLRYYGFAKRLSEMAEAAKLDQKSPARERLRVARMQILAEAQLNAEYDDIDVRAEDQRNYYDANKGKYTTAKVKVIYIPFMANPPKLADPKAKKIMNEAEARALADKIRRDLDAGANFVKLVKQYSEHAESAAKDGDFGVIRGSDKYPEEVKKAVLGAAPGTIAGPLRLGNGFYIFRAEESSVQTYEQVRDQIYTDIKDERYRVWMDKVRSGVQVKLP